MKFVIGHEIGHIQRNHILKSILLAPGLFIPLLGNAYNRACESSCDRYGAYAAGEVDGSVTAMMILSGGKECGRKFDPTTFAAQHDEERGFFKSWYELLSGYPTLSQRVADLQELGNSAQPVKTPRHPLAYLFGLCTPSGGGQGLVALIVFVYIFAILAAIAVPAIAEAKKQAEQTAATAQLLSEGEIHPELIGSWKYGEDDPGNGRDFFTYTTERKSDGTYVTRYSMRTDGEDDAYSITGKWRVTNTSYVEFPEDDNEYTYSFDMPDENTVTFTDPDDGHTSKESRIGVGQEP